MRLNSCWIFSFVVGSLSLTREINESMESVCRPVPLCFPDMRIVVQIFPGRLRMWLLVEWLLVVVALMLFRQHGGGYNFLTVFKFRAVIVAILLKAVARVTAVL